jgi:hypothetical protein
MQSTTLRYGSIFVILTALTVLAFEGRTLRERVGLAEPDPVLVFVIPQRENARRVRAAIDPDRIEWQGLEGLALVGGRVIASDLDAAGNVIEAAGWVDRPIQIVRLENPESRRQDDSLDGESGSDRLARLRNLLNKPTLTPTEQMFVLIAMNDGIEL